MACRSGWLPRRMDCGIRAPEGGAARVRIVPRFAEILSAPERPVDRRGRYADRPAERTGGLAAAAENAIRPLLGARQSSVFSVPSRQATVYAGSMRPITAIREGLRHRAPHLDPPRKVSKQLFNIAPKIREVDEALRANARARRVFEVHPELAFWRLNGGRALTEPKKVKSRPYEPGCAAPDPADRRRAAAAGRERRAAPGRSRRRSARCAGLRRHRAAAACRAGAGHSRTRRRAMHSACRWRSGHDVC